MNMKKVPNGEVCFENFNFNYFKDGPTVLKNLNLNILSSEKVGVGKVFLGKKTIDQTILYGLYIMVVYSVFPNVSHVNKNWLSGAYRCR